MGEVDKSIKIFTALKSSIEEAPSKTTLFFDEESAWTDDRLRIETKLERLKERKHLNEILKQNTAERKKYAGRIFGFTCAWVIIIATIIFFVGFKLMSLSDAVLITLITTTTVNVFGFFLLVVKYLFNPKIDGLNPKKPTNAASSS